jgi:hypothetical protein
VDDPRRKRVVSAHRRWVTASQKAEDAEYKFGLACDRANQQGMTFRELAAATGMALANLHKIVADARKRGEEDGTDALREAPDESAQSAA